MNFKVAECNAKVTIYQMWDSAVASDLAKHSRKMMYEWIDREK